MLKGIAFFFQQIIYWEMLFICSWKLTAKAPGSYPAAYNKFRQIDLIKKLKRFLDLRSFVGYDYKYWIEL